MSQIPILTGYLTIGNAGKFTCLNQRPNTQTLMTVLDRLPFSFQATFCYYVTHSSTQFCLHFDLPTASADIAVHFSYLAGHATNDALHRYTSTDELVHDRHQVGRGNHHRLDHDQSTHVTHHTLHSTFAIDEVLVRLVAEDRLGQLTNSGLSTFRPTSVACPGITHSSLALTQNIQQHVFTNHELWAKHLLRVGTSFRRHEAHSIGNHWIFDGTKEINVLAAVGAGLGHIGIQHLLQTVDQSTVVLTSRCLFVLATTPYTDGIGQMLFTGNTLHDHRIKGAFHSHDITILIEDRHQSFSLSAVSLHGAGQDTNLGWFSHTASSQNQGVTSIGIHARHRLADVLHDALLESSTSCHRSKVVMHVLVAETLSSTTTVAANTHVTTAQQLGMVTRAANYHADTRSVLLRNVPFVVVQCSSRRHLALFFRTLTNQVINNEVQTSCFITRHCCKHILVFLGQVLQCIQGDKLVYSSNKVFIFEEEVFLSVLIEQTRNGFRISQEATTLNTSVHVSSKLRHLLLIQSKVSRISILNVSLQSRHTTLQIGSIRQHAANFCFAEESTKNSQVSLSDTTEQAGPFLFG